LDKMNQLKEYLKVLILWAVTAVSVVCLYGIGRLL